MTRRTFPRRTVLVTLLLLAGVWLVGMSVLQAAGARAWRGGNIDAARFAWRLLPPANLIEQHVAANSDGLAAFADRRYADARDSFVHARDAAPSDRRCTALRNLVLALEANAGALEGAAEELLQEREYRRALRELDGAPGCSADGARDATSARELREARSRIESRTRFASPAGQGIPQELLQYESMAVDRGDLATRVEQLRGFQQEAQQVYNVGGQIARNAGATRVEDGDPRW